VSDFTTRTTERGQCEGESVGKSQQSLQ
jgi:hypothetical protein